MDLISPVTENILQALSKKVYNNPKATADRMHILRGPMLTSAPNAFFEVAVMVQAIAQAPGWNSFPVLNLQQDIEDYCCSLQKGEPLRDLSFAEISSGVTAGNPGYASFANKNYIPNINNFKDFLVTAPSSQYDVPIAISQLRGVCHPTDPTCTTAAPLNQLGNK